MLCYASSLIKGGLLQFIMYYGLCVSALLENSAFTDYDQQVTDCMLSTDPLSKSWPLTHQPAGVVGGVSSIGSSLPLSTPLSQSLPASSSPLSGLSERTKRLLGYISPGKLQATAAGVSAPPTAS